ncbi:MAG TPA: DMT family transporter [Euryarchaeota archaeon]|nr:DMT family transporter [Euryarchaeota archaeon]
MNWTRVMNRIEPIALSLLLFALWGSNPTAVKIGITGVTPLQYAMLRAVIASGFYILMMLVLGKDFMIAIRSLRFTDYIILALVGLLQTTVVFYALAVGVSYVPAGIATVLISTQVLFTVFFSVIIFRERLSLKAVLGIAVAFLSIPIVVIPQLHGAASAKGFIILIIAAVAWSASAIIFKRSVPRSLNPIFVAMLQMWFGATALVLITIMSSKINFNTIPTITGWSLLYTATLGTCIPYTLWFFLLRRFQLSYISTYTFLVPVFGLFFGVVLLGERLLPIQILGVSGVIIGVMTVAFASVKNS